MALSHTFTTRFCTIGDHRVPDFPCSAAAEGWFRDNLGIRPVVTLSRSEAREMIAQADEAMGVTDAAFQITGWKPVQLDHTSARRHTHQERAGSRVRIRAAISARALA